MPEEELRRAIEQAAKCSLMLMIGSSLQVEPAASIPHMAHRAGARAVFINRTETPWDHIADVLFRESAADAMSAIVESLRRR